MSGNVTLAFFQASRPFSKRTLPRRAPTPFGLPTTAPPVASPSATASTNSFTPCPRAGGGCGSPTYGAPGGLPAEFQHRPPSRFQR